MGIENTQFLLDIAKLCGVHEDQGVARPSTEIDRALTFKNGGHIGAALRSLEGTLHAWTAHMGTAEAMQIKQEARPQIDAWLGLSAKSKVVDAATQAEPVACNLGPVRHVFSPQVFLDPRHAGFFGRPVVFDPLNPPGFYPLGAVVRFIGPQRGDSRIR